MPPNEKAPIDTLRLSPRDRQKLVESINRRAKALPDGGKRRHPRIVFNIGTVIILTNTNGTPTKYSVVPRNLSSGGLGFIHGQYMHTGTPCHVVLPMLDGHWARVEGTIIGCRHVAGLIHEVSVTFNETIDLGQFAELTQEQQQANAEILATAQAELGLNRRAGALKGTVLLVDDFESDRILLRHWLEKQGLTVFDAADAAQFHTHLANNDVKIDLIVMDMVLGEDSGLDLIRETRTQNAAVSIIGVSANNNDETEAAALAAGCNAFYGKPLNRLPFLQTVDQLLSFQEGVENQPADQAIHSTLAKDPEMQPLLLRFKDDLAATVAKLTAAIQAKDMPTASRVCQQLKGTGTGFGFPAITQMARLLMGQLHQTTPSEAAITKAVDDLIAVSHRVAVD